MLATPQDEADHDIIGSWTETFEWWGGLAVEKHPNSPSWSFGMHLTCHSAMTGLYLATIQCLFWAVRYWVQDFSISNTPLFFLIMES